MRIAAPLLLLALWGCAGPPAPTWEKPGAGLDDLERARTRCMGDAVAAAGREEGGEGPGDRAVIESTFLACMDEAGWRPAGR